MLKDYNFYSKNKREYSRLFTILLVNFIFKVP
uniref:Uncharacterized protein n=1 Tax=Myoviridae sp. ctCo31 TaxID=2825053 RepID=A0A8S5UMC3_9CAUD|nr:MAG TPA: hypothetical protein [Myoviridae sp. ctCo31]